MTGAKDDEFKRFYDEFKNCEMNKEYYSIRLERVRSNLKKLDIFLAFFGGASAVTSFALWGWKLGSFEIGQWMLGIFGGLAILLTVARPYFGWEKDAERWSSIRAVYGALAALHKEMADGISATRLITAKDKQVFETLGKVRLAAERDEDRPPDKETVETAQDIVNMRYPPGHFRYP